MPLISFIIPAYDLPVHLLSECLQSILQLPLNEEEREIILIDDGSPKSPLQELTDYAEHIIYIRQKNSGLSAARNKGLEICQGRYIQFVDGDDKLLPCGYTHCLDIIKNNPQADLVMFSHTRDEFAKRNEAKDEKQERPMSGTHYMRHNNLQAGAWGYLFKRSILGDLRFTNGILHEDEEFTPLLLLRSEQLIHTTTIAYYYRMRAHSIIQATDKSQTRKRLDDKEHIIMHLSDTAAHLSTDGRTALQRRVNQLTMDYIYDIITCTHSEEELNTRLNRLHQQGLFPLPHADYTQKYKWFRRLSRHAIGRKLMLAISKYGIPKQQESSM